MRSASVPGVEVGCKNCKGGTFSFCLRTAVNDILFAIFQLQRLLCGISDIKIINLQLRMKNILFLCTLICSVISYLTVRNNRIWDANNGQRIFHGLNVVEKVFPYIDLKFNETDMQHFKQWGINGLRLGVMWPGVEPKQGQFDDEYLKKMKQIVEMAAKYNIYTLVQFHQDLFSQKFCADGVPLWAIPESVYSSFPWPISKKTQFDPITGLPPSSACDSKLGWGAYYTTLAVNKAFNHLWTNKSGLLDKFAQYWRKVAATFKDCQSVVAYELINEPWPGNMYTDPLIMIPGFSELTHLSQAYDFLAREIKKVDDKHNICFEPVTWLNEFPAGFKHPPGGFKNANSSILCYHYYKPPSLNPKSFMKARMKDIKRLKVAGILSQFYVEGQQGICQHIFCQWLILIFPIFSQFFLVLPSFLHFIYFTSFLSKFKLIIIYFIFILEYF